MTLESRSRSLIWSFQAAPVTSARPVSAVNSPVLTRIRGSGVLASLVIRIRQLRTSVLRYCQA